MRRWRGDVASAEPVLKSLRQEVSDIDDLSGVALDHGIAEQAGTIACHLDVELVLDDVDDLVDHKSHGAAVRREHQDGLGAFLLQAALGVDAQQRHELIAILHKMSAVGDFDAAAIDLLEAGNQR